jgi:hypothetical protein
VPRKDLPHWSLQIVDPYLKRMVAPAESPAASGWTRTWTLVEFLNRSGSAIVEGSLELTRINGGRGVQLDLVQRRATAQGRIQRSEVSLGCGTDPVLQPLSWEGRHVLLGARGEDALTVSTDRGSVKGGRLKREGVIATSEKLAKGAPVTSSWSLLAAMPEIAAAGHSIPGLTVLEELVQVREDQVLEPIGEVVLPSASGEVPATMWRRWGPSQPTLVTYVDQQGWPLVVVGLGHALWMSA